VGGRFAVLIIFCLSYNRDKVSLSARLQLGIGEICGVIQLGVGSTLREYMGAELAILASDLHRPA
jgi:hypothetical protein